MTDEAKALVERVAMLPDGNAWPSTVELLCDLRDYIETQARENAAKDAELAKWKERRLLDHGRLLWREDVETHCPNPDLCFEYSTTVRCSPCAIKQSDAEGVEALSLNDVYQPEVARLNRELAKFKALAETLAGYVEHKGGCRRGLWPEISPTLPCDCGLSEVHRQYKEATQ